MSDNTPVLGEFLQVFRKHVGEAPDKLARACIEAAFDHLLNPPELDRLEGPFEEEAHQVEAKLLGFISDEASSVCELIRRRDTDG
jgi:hypothetical protein